MKPEKLTDDQVQMTIRRAIEDARAFIDAEIAPARLVATKYVEGGTSVEHEEGRSGVVATKCRDAIRAIKPVLMRIFLQADQPVEFVPTRPENVQAAEQATAFARYVFDKNSGFQALMDVIHDALVKKVGILKPYFLETEEADYEEYSNLSDDELALMQFDDPDMNVVEWDQDEETGTYSIKVLRKDSNGEIKFDAIGPEDFFIDGEATSIDDCYVCGDVTTGRVGDLVAQGFDFAEVVEHAGIKEETNYEAFERVNHLENDDDSATDPSMRRVQITTAFMRMDIDGTGIPQRYRFLCVGDDYHILERTLCGHKPYAIFEVDPEPHTFFGWSLADLLINDQDAATALIRGLIDGLAMMNNPRVAAQEGMVNMDDLMNNEYGGVIRTKGMPSAVLQEFTVGATASVALPAIQYYEDSIRAKTGVLGAGMGMDADALQGNTATGVDAAVQAATAQTELIARTLAEGGMRDLFEIIGTLARAHPQQNEMMRVDGKFVPVDPTSWGALDVRANVGLGTNRHNERQMALTTAFQIQSQIYQQYGPANGLVTLTNIRNTLADTLKMSGIHNVDRYFAAMDPETEAALMQQQQEAQQGQTDPTQQFMQIEGMKMQAKAQSDAEKNKLARETAQARVSADAAKMAMDNDLQRDKLAQERELKSQEIAGKFGIAVDQNRIRAEQAMPRQPGR